MTSFNIVSNLAALLLSFERVTSLFQLFLRRVWIWGSVLDIILFESAGVLTGAYDADSELDADLSAVRHSQVLWDMTLNVVTPRSVPLESSTYHLGSPCVCCGENQGCLRSVSCLWIVVLIISKHIPTPGSFEATSRARIRPLRSAKPFSRH